LGRVEHRHPSELVQNSSAPPEREVLGIGVAVTHEQKFFDAVRDVFVGARVEGQSGYLNLMQIKASYFEKAVKSQLIANVADELKDFLEFREEMFDKLYSFFSRYFCKSG
jgi:adenine-specific DNA-methyltransferase